MAERFQKGDNVTSPVFRRELNEVADNADAAARLSPTNMVGLSGGSLGAVLGSPAKVTPKLCRITAGKSWAFGTHDGDTDDVKSVECDEVWLDVSTNTYERQTDYTLTVFNSPGAALPDTGDVFWATLNTQSGRWELLSKGAGATTGVVKGYLGEGWYDVETYSEPTPPADAMSDYYCGFGQANHDGGGSWSWDMGLDQYENRQITLPISGAAGGYGVDEYVGLWSAATTYTGTKIVHTEAADGTRTYWAATYPGAIDDGDIDQVAPSSSPANLNRDPNTAAGGPFWMKLRCTSGPLPTNDPGGTGEKQCVSGVLLKDGEHIPPCDGDFEKAIKWKNMWTDANKTARSAVKVDGGCLPECEECPNITGGLDSLYSYSDCKSATDPVYATQDNTGGAIIDSVTFVGSVASGTYSDTASENSVYHSIDDATDDIDIVYGFDVGTSTALSMRFTGYLQGSGDEMKIKAYDHVAATWDIIGTVTGAAGTDNVTIDADLESSHTGTGGEDGKVYIRFDTDSTTPENLSVDELYVLDDTSSCSGCKCDWEYNEDCARYELASACGYGCTCTAPDVPDPAPADRATATSDDDSTAAVTCSSLGDPADPCCSWDAAGTCTPQTILDGCQTTLPRALGTASGTIIKAFQSASAPIPDGMNVTVMPMGANYAIVDWELNLQCIEIPLSFKCCDDGSLIVNEIQRYIVNGWQCNNDVNDCA